MRSLSLAPIDDLGCDAIDECMIVANMWSRPPTRPRSACEQTSRAALAAFTSAHPILTDLPIIHERKVVERAMIIATGALGPDAGLSEAQIARKSAYHLTLVAQAFSGWILDDTIDRNTKADARVLKDLTDFYRGLLRGDALMPSREEALRDDCLRSDIVPTFPQVLALLAAWQRRLLRGTRLSLDPSTLFGHLTAGFVESCANVRQDFDSLEDYFTYRTVGGALGFIGLCGAHWFCELHGLSADELDEERTRYQPLVERYALIGALSNDLIGYDKDVQEGVTTAVTVARRYLPSTDSADDHTLMQTFALLFAHHNALLRELSVKRRESQRGVEQALLTGLLASAHAMCVLHHEYRAIYASPTFDRALLRVLRERELTNDPFPPVTRAVLRRT